MKTIRCLRCMKIIGEVEGIAKLKCKAAGCHTMNLINTHIDFHGIENETQPTINAEEWKLQFNK